MNNHINYFGIPFMSDSSKDENEKSFFTVPVAFQNGAVEKDIYDGYKNYMPRPYVLNNTKDGLMKTIQAYYFVLNDLTLYLDVNSEDKEALDYFNRVVKEFNEAMDSYIKNYGPLNIYSSEEQTWIWNKTWPWERGTY